MEHLVIAELSGLEGYLKSGHLELILNDKQLKDFNNMSEDDKKDLLECDGNLIIDNYTLNDYEIGNINID